MRQWSAAPSRREFGAFIDWQERQLALLGVDVRLGQAATPNGIAAIDPDVVVLASGSRPVRTPVQFDDGSVPLVTPADAFGDRLPPGEIVIFDEMGELDTALIAEHLQDQGRSVTLVTARLHIGEGERINTLFTMLRNLAERGIHMVERNRLAGLRNGQAHLVGVFGGPSTTLRADVLVGWSGGDPVLDLYDPLRAAGYSPVLIGDALRPRRVSDATADAKSAIDGLRAPARAGSL